MWGIPFIFVYYLSIPDLSALPSVVCVLRRLVCDLVYFIRVFEDLFI